MKVCFFEVRKDEEEEIARLTQQNPGLEVLCYDHPLSKENMQDLAGAESISILGGTKVNRELLDGLLHEGVTCICTRTIGCNHIDTEYAGSIGIQIHTAAYPPNAVADFAVMLMLMAVRRYKPALWRQQVNDFSLPGLMGRNFNELTVGIVGTGRIGRKVAENLSGFGCRILAFDHHPDEERMKNILEYCSLEKIYREADIITLHVPYLPENEGMINKDTIAGMKDGVILINTARGELMDLDDVIAGVESQKIGGVAMDVFKNDIGIYHVNHKSDILVNPKMAYLRQFPNVILTQHMAFYTEESVNSMVQSSFRVFAEKMNDAVQNGYKKVG